MKTITAAIIGGVIGSLLTAGLVLAEKEPEQFYRDVIIARTFVLSDENNKALMLITTNEHGPKIGMNDRNGHGRLLIGIRENGDAGVIVTDDNKMVSLVAGEAGPHVLIADGPGDNILLGTQKGQDMSITVVRDNKVSWMSP